MVGGCGPGGGVGGGGRYETQIRFKRSLVHKGTLYIIIIHHTS